MASRLWDDRIKKVPSDSGFLAGLATAIVPGQGALLRDGSARRARLIGGSGLSNRAAQTGLGLDRLRRGVFFERILARLEAAQPGRWVLKGGMALEVRLGDDARVTKDTFSAAEGLVGQLWTEMFPREET